MDKDNAVKCMLNTGLSKASWCGYLPQGKGHLGAVVLVAGQNGPQAQRRAVQKHRGARPLVYAGQNSGVWLEFWPLGQECSWREGFQ